jgi:hypothetical protein
VSNRPFYAPFTDARFSSGRGALHERRTLLQAERETDGSTAATAWRAICVHSSSATIATYSNSAITAPLRIYRYGCVANHKRGEHVCGTALKLPIERVDGAVLGELGGKILRPAVVMAIVDGVLDACGRAQVTTSGCATSCAASSGRSRAWRTPLQRAGRFRRSARCSRASFRVRLQLDLVGPPGIEPGTP